ncbi:MAG: WYL domain-containing protein [Nocardioidaceae bacterium]
MAGRDQREPMERLTRVLAVLSSAGDKGVPVDRLEEAAGFASTDQGARRDQLKRDLRHLTRHGWQIDNVAEDGAPAVYRLVAVDNRLAVRLTAAQATELQRAALLADRADLVARLGLPEGSLTELLPADLVSTGHDEALDTVVEAVRLGSRLRFRYSGSPRVAHPHSVRTELGTWYLYAREEDAQGSKHFVVSRMSEVTADAPGTAIRDAADPRTGLHPLTWRLHEPVEVVLETTPEFRDDVVGSLRRPESESSGDGAVRLRYSVTNLDALVARLFELGRRVRIVSPDSLRERLIGELERIVGESR